VLAMETSMAGANYVTTMQVENLVAQVTRRIESLPGVEGAASAITLPVSGMGVDLPFNIAGRPPEKGQYNGDEQWRSVSPHYFQVLQVPLLRGRVFTSADTGNSPHVLVINQAMARKYWPKQDPIGQVIQIGRGIGPQFEEPPRKIVGVVGNVREQGLGEGEVPVMYVPQSQVQEGLTALANSVIPLSWAVRTTGDPGAYRIAVERELHAVDGMMPVTKMRTLNTILGQSLARQNFNMLLLAIFAGIALLLAAIGIYGLMAYSVEQRLQEIGIRVALGAGRRDVTRLIFMQGMRLAGAGVAAGLAAAWGVTRLLSTLLYGVKAGDPPTFAAVAGLVALIALAAAWIPARRAAGTDPSVALRHQ